jgi:hypothetical protein
MMRAEGEDSLLAIAPAIRESGVMGEETAL